ncbi:MAG: glycine--tRNA ligase subunit beta [Candidatus Omnitrophota bacterium]|jgi:glycyl-tRNA synthetase beta chain
MAIKKEKSDFLLEINVEELPAGYVRPALDRLKAAFIERLKAERIAHGDIIVYGTAVSLICYIKEMLLRQEELSQEISGPPKRIAFDENNNLTPQGMGFAKNQGVRAEELKMKQTPKGEYLFVVKKTASRPSREVLRSAIPDIIKSIAFPKTMKWDDSGMRFARPIQSVAALLGRENIKFEMGNVSMKIVKGADPAAYLGKIEKTYILDQDKRKKEIEKMILAAQKKAGMDEGVDKNLLEETNFMVKSPVLMMGEFDKKFLDVPKDVLAASMSKHQRLFTLSRDGGLVNRFIAIIDGKGRDLKKMRKIYADILEARLKDSLFFYKEDTRLPFAELTPKLKDLIFQKDLGNMFEKIQRLEELSSFISEKLGINADRKEDIKKAARLCKTDLVTQMVGEFPSLQGAMGMEYSLRSGEKSSVAAAIKEHYLPKGTDDDLPETIEGAVVAISDRIDNITGFLGSGIEPKGSFDPFGIRRNSQGMIQIIKSRSFRLELRGLIKKAIELYKGRLRISGDELEKKITGYIKERLEFLAPDTRPLELKRAVLEAGCDDIVAVFKKVDVLSDISGEKYFLKAAKVCERTSNILKGARGENIGAVNEGLLKEEQEKEVWKAYSADSGTIKELIKQEKYKEATRVYGESFFGPLHEFFDNVLVNAEDAALRGNRLAMMQAVNRLYTNGIADLAMLPQIVVQ